MFCVSSNSNTYIFNQDTIRISSDYQDSVLTDTIATQLIDTATEVSFVRNDTLPARETIKMEKESVSISDGGRSEIETKQAVDKKSDLSQGRVDNSHVKKQPRLSWNSTEDFAKKIFSYEKDKTVQFQTSRHGSDTTYAIIQRNEPTFYKRLQQNTGWIFWTYIIIMVLLLWIKIFYQKYFTSLFNSSISYHMSSKLFNERNVLTRRVSVVFNFIYVVSVSLVVFKIFQYLGVRSKTFDRLSLFLIILNLIILFSISKIILQKLIGFIFFQLDRINEYLHHVYVYNKILGIFLLPISFAAFYTPANITEILLVAAILFYFISIIFKIIRGFQIIIKNDVFIFYSILYLCTLEILPLIIGIKFFKSLA